MANASHAYQNLVYQVGLVTPDTTICKARFRFSDRPLQFGAEQSPEDRLFSVYWDSSEEPLEIEDLAAQWGHHTLILEVAYNAEREIDKLHQIILSDRFNLKKRLRNGDYFTGYTGQSSVDVGLKNRHFLGDELDRGDDVSWILRQRWRHEIEETE